MAAREENGAQPSARDGKGRRDARGLLGLGRSELGREREWAERGGKLGRGGETGDGPRPGFQGGFPFYSF